MTLSCPACGKTQPIPAPAAGAGDSREVETCDRCGCDLSRLWAILRTAGELLRVAKVSLELGAWELGLSSASRSWDLAHSAHSARVASLAAAALGDIAALERWRRRTE